MTNTELERGAEKVLTKTKPKDRKTRPPKPSEGKLILTVKETAKRLGIDIARAYEAAEAGQIPTIMLGKRRVVPVAALERMLSEVKATGEAA